MDISGYCDLNVIYSGNDPIEIIRNCHENLYRTIALSQLIDLVEVNDQKKKKKSERLDVVVPEPVDIKLPADIAGKITVLNRLNIKVADPSKLSKLFQSKGPSLQKFDIIAAVPMDQACIQLICGMNDIDVISVDCLSKPEWKLNRKSYNFAVEQNKYIEILYGPAVRDSSTLKNTIFMSHEFYSVGKARNIIISSGTSNSNLLRSPYEIVFLSLIFGLGENQARLAISSTPAAALSRALKRRQGKTCMDVSLKA